LKIQNGHQQRSKFALKPYGKQHFHLLLENSRTEFNQTWQRCEKSLPSLVLNYIKDCQSILEEVVSADRAKNNNKMAKLSN
jgi:hypothetical protein